MAEIRIEKLHKRFSDFVAVRDRLDPTGMFANPYLDRVLGVAETRSLSGAVRRGEQKP